MVEAQKPSKLQSESSDLKPWAPRFNFSFNNFRRRVHHGLEHKNIIKKELSESEKSRIQLPDIIIEPLRVKQVKFSKSSNGLELRALKKMISENKVKTEQNSFSDLKIKSQIWKSTEHNFEEKSLLPDIGSEKFNPSIFKGVFEKPTIQKVASLKDGGVQSKKIDKKVNRKKEDFFDIPKIGVPSLFKLKSLQEISSKIKAELDNPVGKGHVPTLLKHTREAHLKTSKNISLSNRNNPALINSIVTKVHSIPKFVPTLKIMKEETKKIPNEVILEYGEVQEIKQEFSKLSEILNNIQKGIHNSLDLDKREEKVQIEKIMQANNGLKSSVDFLKKDLYFKE
jgi:hypothetical protein